jgi:hypothetical protein
MYWRLIQGSNDYPGATFEAYPVATEARMEPRLILEANMLRTAPWRLSWNRGSYSLDP